MKIYESHDQIQETGNKAGFPLKGPVFLRTVSLLATRFDLQRICGIWSNESKIKCWFIAHQHTDTKDPMLMFYNLLLRPDN
jgi:hypothetical protein